MTSMASSSISRRTSASGQCSPRMCSLSASPLPTPRLKRPSSMTALVAAAWATTAGWMRRVGQVTPVVTPSPVVAAIAPITDHTNGLWPCSSFHGWLWSEIQSAWKPAASARLARATSSWGPHSSDERKQPIFIDAPYPAPRAAHSAHGHHHGPHLLVPRPRRGRPPARPPRPLPRRPRADRLRAERLPHLRLPARARLRVVRALQAAARAYARSHRGGAGDDRRRRLHGQRLPLLPRRPRRGAARGVGGRGDGRPHHARLAPRRGADRP